MSTVEELVVTARKREENIQNIPVAVTALQGSELARQGIRQPSDLSRSVPSLDIETGNASTGTGMIVVLRGQSASDIILTQSQPVGIYEDGVNIPHPVGSNLGFFDVSRVEVLKGPQGTLYGRNTTGGAVNIITRGADYNGYHGYVYAEGGNYSDVKVTAAVNLPIVPDMLAARIAYQHWSRDGYGQSLITGERFGGDHDDDVVRASLKFDPVSTFSATAMVEYFHASRNDALYQTRFLYNPAETDQEWAAEGGLGGVAPSALVANTTNLFVNYSDKPTYEHLAGWHGVLDMSWDINDYVRLRSITGLHAFKDYRTFDMDALPLQAFTSGLGIGGVAPTVGANTQLLPPDEASRQWTQEVNLGGDAFANRFKWLVGAFVSDDNGDMNQTASVYPEALNAAALGFPFDVEFYSPAVSSQTWALYTQNDVKFNDVFSITFGGRYTEERLRQDIGFFLYNLSPAGSPVPYLCQAGPNARTAQATAGGCLLSQNAKFTGTSYLLSFNFQLTPNTLFYAKTARGFRGGALQVRAPNDPPARPEIATDYELGLKTDLFDHHLRADLAAYQTNYSNKQETAIVINNGVQTTPIVNAAQARIRGVEAELTAVPMKGLTLTASGSWLDAQYLDYPNALTAWGDVVNASGTTIVGQRRDLPPWSFNIGAEYSIPVGPGEVGVNGNYAWHSKIPNTILTNDPSVPQSIQNEWGQAIGLLNANIEYRLPDHGLTFAIFATNLLNKHYQTEELTFSNFGVTGVTQEPRMWGVSIRKTFGDE